MKAVYSELASRYEDLARYYRRLGMVMEALEAEYRAAEYRKLAGE